MALTPPPPYSNITGITKAIDNHANCTLADYNGNAKPGELVVDLTTSFLYVGLDDGNLRQASPPTPPGFDGEILFGSNGQITSSPALEFDATSNTLHLGGDLIPQANVTYSLGNATNQWKDLWVSSSTIFINSVPLSLAADNNLTIDGNPIVTTNANTGATNITEMNVSGNLSATDISVIGNIAAGTNFIGNGALLTDLPTLDNFSNANVEAFLASGTDVSDIVTSANVSASYVLGNVAFATGFPTVDSYSNANVEGFLASGTDASDIVTSANVSGAFFLGNVAFATGFPTLDNYSNANVEGFLASGDIASNITTTANVSGAYIIGDGSQLTNLPILDAYSNANVAAYLPTYGGNLAGGNLFVSGNVDGTYLLGNGAFITGLPASYSNANTAAFLAVNTGNISALDVSGTGNITGAYLLGNGAFITGLPAGYANSNVAAYLPGYGGDILAANVGALGDVSAVANVTGSYLLGNGAFITGLPAGYSNADVAAYLPTYGGDIGANIVTATNLVGEGGNVTNIQWTNITDANVEVTSVISPFIANIDANLANTDSNVANLTSSLANTDANIVVISNNLANTNSNVANTDANIVVLTNDLANTNSNVTNLTNDLANTDANIVVLTSDLANTDANIVVLTSDLANTDSNVANIVSDLANTNAVLSNAEANITTLQGQVYTNANVAAYLPTSNVDILANSLTMTGNTSANNINIQKYSRINFEEGGHIFSIPDGGLVGTTEVNGATDRGISLTAGGFTPGSSYAQLQWVQDINNYDPYSAANSITNWVYVQNDGIYLENIDNVTANATYDHLWKFGIDGNLSVPGSISGVGNVEALYFIGNGASLTGLPATYANSDVAAYLDSGNLTSNVTTTGDVNGDNALFSNTVTASLFIGNFQGNISGNLVVPGSNTQVLFNNLGNAGADVGFTYNKATQNIWIANTVTGGNVAVDGDVASDTVTANTVTAANISAGVGNIALQTNTIKTTANTITVDPMGDGSPGTGNVRVLGNLSVTGNLTYVDVSSAVTSNLTWIAANSAATAGDASGGGLTVGPAGTPYASWTYSEPSNSWVSDIAIEANGGANINGPLDGATTGRFAGSVFAMRFWGEGSKISNLTGGNVTGQVANALVAGTVYEPAQPNITSVGALTDLYVLSDVLVDGNVIGVTAVNTPLVVASVGDISELHSNSVYANYLYGDASGLTNVPTGSILLNGNSNVAITDPDGPITMAVNGVSVANITDTTLSLGQGAGESAQLANAIAIGYGAASLNQQTDAIAIGASTATSSQGANAVAIGHRSGGTNQHANSVAIGAGAESPNAGIVLNATGSQFSGLNAGFYVNPVREDVANISQSVMFNPTSKELTYANTLSLAGNITGSNVMGVFHGDGSNISNITPANISGQVANALVAGTVYTNAQPNITSVGILSSVSVTGAATVGSVSSGGDVVAGGVVSATGNAIAANLVTSGLATVVGNVIAGNVTTSGNVSAVGNVWANYLVGNGSAITNLAIISNGTSNVSVIGNSNITMTVSNVATFSLGTNTVAIGRLANAQGANSIAIGVNAGSNSSATNTIAIGTNAAANIQSVGSIAIGANAATSWQGNSSIAFGNTAGANTQYGNSIAIGTLAGANIQGANSIAIGTNAGNNVQSGTAVAIGVQAGQTNQGNTTVALGYQAAGISYSVTANNVIFANNTMSVFGPQVGNLRNTMLITGDGVDANTRITSTSTGILGNASITGNTLTVRGVISTNYPVINSVITGNGVAANTIVTDVRVSTMANTSISGTTLTVGTLTGDPIEIGMYLSASGMSAGYYIINNLSGTGDGSTWQLNAAGTMTARTVTGRLWTVDPVQTTSNVTMTSIIYNMNVAQTANIANIVAYSGQGDSSIAVGYRAGGNTQGIQSIAIGYRAGQILQSDSAIAIGMDSGGNVQGVDSVAIGSSAGNTGQSTNAVAVGRSSGQTNQGVNAVAVGVNAGISTQGQNSVAVGVNSGYSSQGVSAVSVGQSAGQTTQGTYGVAVGYQAGTTSQGSYGIAIGATAGGASQASYGVAIGTNAGSSAQGTQAIGISYYAGADNQGAYAIALGGTSGQIKQGSSAIAIGYQSARYLQQSGGVAIGLSAATNLQATGTTAVGAYAGQDAQRTGATAIGYQSGSTGITATTNSATFAGNVMTISGNLSNVSGTIVTGQGLYYTGVNANVIITSLGTGTGNVGTYILNQNVGNITANTSVSFYTGQGQYATALGYQAGYWSQSANAIAIGYQAGRYYQGNNSVIIGGASGNNAGVNSIAIGFSAVGNASVANSIVLNATGSPITANNAGIYIKPIRNDVGNTANVVTYNTTTGELTYANTITVNSVVSSTNLPTAVISRSIAPANATVVGQVWDYDVSSTSLTLANAAVVYFKNFSGSIMVNNWGSSSQGGAVTQWLCGGASFAATGNSRPNVAVGIMAYDSGNAGYTWTANSGTTEAYSFYVVRTRNVA